MSLISVLVDSAPGDDAVFQPKKDVILFPGVLGGLFVSAEPEGILGGSILSGGGRFEGGCKAMVSDRL